MSYLLDILTTTIIGAFIMLLVMEINMRISDSYNQMIISSMIQSNAIASAEIIQNDVYKIGYNNSGSSIGIADSTQIKFYGDIDNNGIVDTIFYSEGDSTELTNSVNPKDRPLYRERNGGNKNLITTITDFRVTYYDSTGNELTYLQLNNQNFRDKIKTLKIYFRFESADPVDGFYNAAEWLRIIRPRNI